MAISTFGELKASIATYLARSDLTASIPDFVKLAEQRINYGSGEPGDMYFSRALRIRQMAQVDEDLTISSDATALPSGFLELRHIRMDQATDQVLEYVTPDQLRRKYDSAATGVPRLCYVDGESLVVWPSPDASYTAKITYWKAFDAFSSDSDTNWLLTNAPGAYLYGALLEAAPFLREPERLSEFFALYKAATGGLMTSEKRSRQSAASLQARPIGSTW